MTEKQKFLFVGGPFAGEVEEHEHAVIEKFSEEWDHGEPFLLKHIYIAKSLASPKNSKVARLMVHSVYEALFDSWEADTYEALYNQALEKGAYVVR